MDNTHSFAAAAAPDSATTPLIKLDRWGALAVEGPDAAGFLQGQLTADLLQLAPAALQPAGLLTPQGRVLAILWLAHEEGRVLAIAPRELVPGLVAHLDRYVLRAKVKLRDLSDELPLTGRLRDADAPLAAGEWRWSATRSVRFGTAATGDGGDQAWERQAVVEGEPVVVTASQGRYTAQQLNLDTLGAISFEKGCYTGQEIVARTHYRGQVKRRLQRLDWPGAAAPAIGEVVALPDGTRAEVVRAANVDGVVAALLLPLAAGETA